VDRGPDDDPAADPAAEPAGDPADPFEAIVAVWRREGAVPTWPADDRPPAEQPRTSPLQPPVDGSPVPPPAPPQPQPHRPPELDHFVPPEPPPLPRIGPPAAVGLTLLVLGLTLVLFPGLVGVSDVYGLPLGLLSLACGLGWLVLRLWPGPPEERDDDDGALL
jgi:hypothetical protein